MHPFRYHRPTTIEAALAMHAGADDARFLAGGQTLVPVLRHRLDAPSDLIDLADVPGLVGITEEAGVIHIGAMTSHAAIAADPALPHAVRYLAGEIGDPLVRNRGTIGGSIANNDPAADWPAAALGLGATIRTDRRDIAADDFFQGMFETALEPGEMICRISLPRPRIAGYGRIENPASRFPLAAVFLSETAAGIRVAVTGNGTGAFRLEDAEARLGGGLSADRLSGLAVPADRVTGDSHASSEFRRHLIAVACERALKAALSEAP